MKQRWTGNTKENRKKVMKLFRQKIRIIRTPRKGKTGREERE